MHYLVMSTLITLSLKEMLCNISMLWIGFLLKGLWHLLSIGCITYLFQNNTGIVLNMLLLEVLFIVMV